MELEKKFSCRSQDNVRMAGFLEKKGKMKLMSQWKKYWFVLEERLLLYYRSETEYTNLSPCRGSLNMGLVSTVRPGASTGPCIIHVITRTQVVQLRAKNRQTQEIWLQALLHSMSLPLVTKTLKPSTLKKNLLKYGYSLDSISFHEEGNFEKEWTLPRKLDYRKRQISGTFYGGSLDTVIWSKKIKPMRTPSPSVPNNQMSDFVKESESVGRNRSKNSRLSLCDEEEMKYVGEDSDPEIEVKSERKCKVHDENRNHDLYSVVDKRKKKLKTWSDTDLNKTSKSPKKDESPFERIKNALSRLPKEKILRSKSGTRPPRKRRESFLLRVFKKKESDRQSRGYESDVSDPLYDTIGRLPEQPRSLIPVVSSQEEEKNESEAEECLYTQVQKPVVGSRTILPPNAMSELKSKLKSRESLERQDDDVSKAQPEEEKDPPAPTLPPRRGSRPISPWHDVPTNNAPVSSNKTPFFVHQAIVKFNDSSHITRIKATDFEEDTYSGVDPVDNRRNSFSDSIEGTLERKKNDDLSALLEQLTKITVAPLAEPESTDDVCNSSSESEKLWTRSRYSEPDYDVPRPHKPFNALFWQGNEIISSTEFMGRYDNNSDTSSSFRSMEPDSLEMADKKIITT